MTLQDSIRQRKRRSAVKGAAITAVMLVVMVVAVSPIKYVILPIMLFSIYSGFKACWGDGYLAAVEDARGVVDGASLLAKSVAAAEIAAEALKNGAGMDDPRVVRARELIDQVEATLDS